MTIPTSNIRLSANIAAEFGTAATLKSNYGQGGAPSSGEISIIDFAGRSGETVIYDKPTMTSGDVSAWAGLGTIRHTTLYGGAMELVSSNFVGGSCYLPLTGAAGVLHTYNVTNNFSEANWQIGIGYSANSVLDIAGPTYTGTGAKSWTFTPSQATFYIKLIVNSGQGDNRDNRWNGFKVSY